MTTLQIKANSGEFWEEGGSTRAERICLLCNGQLGFRIILCNLTPAQREKNQYKITDAGKRDHQPFIHADSPSRLRRNQDSIKICESKAVLAEPSGIFPAPAYIFTTVQLTF